MSISAEGTFHYVGVVPGDWPSDAVMFEVRDVSDTPHSQRRLVGLSPRLEVVDLGTTARRTLPESDATGERVPLTTFVLRSADPSGASIAGFSFALDRGFGERSLPGDVWHLVRTFGAGLGVSVLRQGRLVAAIGVASNVPLGLHLQARVVVPEPDAAIDWASVVELPFEMAADDGVWRRLPAGRWEVGEYAVAVERMRQFIEDGHEERVAIWRLGDLPLDPGIHHARMLAHEVAAPWRLP